VPVKPRLVIANPPPAEQQTVPYTQSQVSEKLNGQYDHLIGRDPLTNQLQPELATEWSVAPNGKDWTVKLRKGVPFYKDGKAIPGSELTVKDVELTWKLLIGELTDQSRSPGNWASRLGGPGEHNWEFPDNYTIIMHAPKVFLGFDNFVSDEWESGVISKKQWDAVGGEEGFKADPVGNGPWTYASHSINQDFLHKRVENHYRKTPEFHERHILLVQEATTRLAMLLAKEADIIPLVRSTRNQVTQNGFKTEASTFPSVHQSISIIRYREDVYCENGQVLPGSGVPNCGKSPGGYDPNDPMRNTDVRLALNYAFNRDEFNQVYYNNLGFPLVDYFPPWREDFKDEWAPVPGPLGKTGREGGWPYPYDVAKAKQMLTDAGYPNGFSTILNCLRSHNVIPEWSDMCETVKDYFGAIGVDVELEFVNAFGEFRDQARSRSRPNWMWSASPSLDPICDAIEFSMVWELGIGYREWEEASTLYEECAEVTTNEELIRISQKFGDAWVDKAFSVPIAWVTAEVAYNPGVVAEYRVNQLHMGPIRYHEYTKAVTQ
jgi:ABC-type transport system substrate-binding protein